MRRRIRRVLLSGAAALLAIPASPAAGQADTEVSFSIKEARAYAFRVPLRSEVIQAAGLRDEFQECDPAEDPYQCDTTQYEHRPNCPPDEAYGRRGRAPGASAPEGVASERGGAGDGAGGEERPERSSPIALNDLVTLGTLGRLGGTAEARGLASDSYVDLSGRQEPQAHTESDAFSPNAAAYEERCHPRENGGVADSHVHVLSRSSETPETYHLAECHRRECTFFGGAAIGSSAEEGRTVVHLARRGDRVVGELTAVLKEASWGDGELTVDSMETVVRFSSDGTANGLRWSAVSTAGGASLGGRAVRLPPGRIVGGGGLQVGVAAPFVEAAGDGSELRIVAPGLFVAHQEQAAFFAGAEVQATFGRQAPFVLGGGPLSPGPPSPGGGGGLGATGFLGSTTGGDEVGTAGSAPETETGGTAGPAAPVVLTEQVRTGGEAMVLILALGLAALFLLLSRWVGRYGWGRRLYRIQPFRALDWIYRAFVKT